MTFYSVRNSVWVRMLLLFAAAMLPVHSVVGQVCDCSTVVVDQAGESCCGQHAPTTPACCAAEAARTGCCGSGECRCGQQCACQSHDRPTREPPAVPPRTDSTSPVVVPSAAPAIVAEAQDRSESCPFDITFVGAVSSLQRCIALSRWTL